MDEIEQVVQGKIDTDTEFLSSLADLSEEDKVITVDAKRAELRSAEIKSLLEKASEGTKAKELADSYKTRAEKAEAKVAKAQESSKDELPTKDVLYLAKADIHDDDIEEVLEYSKLKKISVQDAHKFMKPILDVRGEERRTAESTITRGGPRGTPSQAPEKILEEAEKGAEVEGTDANMRAIFEARQARRFNNRPKVR